MIALDITSEEIESRTMTPEHLQAAVEAVRRDGVVVLNNVVDRQHLAVLREKMLEDVQALLARDDAPYNFNTSNVQQDPPPFPPYLFRDVLLNDMAVAVTKALLGPGLKNNFYSGNTAIKSTLRQPVHADGGQLWPDQEVAHPAFCLIVNVPVVAMSEENGSTEIWPGSHRDTTVSLHDDIKVPEKALERRRAVAPPFQPTVPLGSILIRDNRLWHAGMPNKTDQPRPMIAMIHYIHWWNEDERLTFPKGTEAFFKDSELRTIAEFVDGPIDYIRKPHAYDYQPEKPQEQAAASA
jgi:ectoine hydroxylase-related dioxygenase (phytanoyl-CoA dioxygenase family)